ncbi:uncharacterized protein Nmag_0417 [Natrialba magadii ATCC 43099]|uniref:Uncharacterized protein n=1 Tax=Natrialba magadii (strain ATCC 43099 / DSM 3394 / CCM 3739 / CIP 104546 / IAM 13178 / JCM 8861 / NBRC 102185 / NCIMB 2190 / MS3) TaxID=547559 RepID=D3SXW5_NATMM|nr:hypothetical protein [Natrialba magadii]ADD04005.1 uncharacterized protein Nmag_0417 [Natrialba magadii ATCC 43099]ELY33162.1 hypothetical protein C500_02499 [Natrialba magadii ATCC 43099]
MTPQDGTHAESAGPATGPAGDQVGETSNGEHAMGADQHAEAEAKADADDDAGPVSLTRKPTVFSSGCAFGAAFVAAAATLFVPGTDLAVFGVAVLGALALAIGLLRGRPRVIDGGALVIFATLILAGIETPVVEPLIAGTVATVLAWDLGHSGLDLGSQLGREARTIRLEIVQLGSSLLVGLLAGTIGYGVYVFGASGQPTAAVALLLLAAALITVGLGTNRSDDSDQRRHSGARNRPPR